jgi:hypothetical protein
VIGIIYKSTNKINGKEYIGQTVQTLYNRRKQGYGDTKYGRAIKKYGKENFEYTILWELESDDKRKLTEDLNILEEIEIGVRDLTNRDTGYNTKMGGFNGSFTHTPEAIEKIRQASLSRTAGRFVKGSSAWKLRKETPQTEEHKRKVSEGLKRAYALGTRVSWNTGKKSTEEHRMKISKANKGVSRGGFPTHSRWHVARGITNGSCEFCNV